VCADGGGKGERVHQTPENCRSGNARSTESPPVRMGQFRECRNDWINRRHNPMFAKVASTELGFGCGADLPRRRCDGTSTSLIAKGQSALQEAARLSHDCPFGIISDHVFSMSSVENAIILDLSDRSVPLLSLAPTRFWRQHLAIQVHAQMTAQM
jgi:hypothetical protein